VNNRQAYVRFTGKPRRSEKSEFRAPQCGCRTSVPHLVHNGFFQDQKRRLPEPHCSKSRSGSMCWGVNAHQSIGSASPPPPPSRAFQRREWTFLRATGDPRRDKEPSPADRRPSTASTDHKVQIIPLGGRTKGWLVLSARVAPSPLQLTPPIWPIFLAVGGQLQPYDPVALMWAEDTCTRIAAAPPPGRGRRPSGEAISNLVVRSPRMKKTS